VVNDVSAKLTFGVFDHLDASSHDLTQLYEDRLSLVETYDRLGFYGQTAGAAGRGWRTFLHNRAPDIAAMDLFVAPTIGFDLLYALVIVRLDHKELVWINVSANPTTEWVARNGGISL
jgi:hypothetical protein